MKQIIGAVSVIFVVVSLITILFTFNQVDQEQTRLQNDIQYRSYLLSNSLKESVEPNFISKSDAYLQSLVERFVDQQRIAGLAVVDNTGKITAVSSSLPKDLPDVAMIATENMDADLADGKFVNFSNGKMYVYASPLHDPNKSVVGALIVVQNAGYIDTRLSEIWRNNLLRLSVQSFLISIVVLLILRWIIYIPIRKLVEAMQLTRNGANNKSSYRAFDNPIFGPLLKEVSKMQLNLIEARIAASEEAKLSLEKLDSPWTAERLKAFVQDIVKNRKIFVVSNREPYIHTQDGNKISYHSPASGVVTAMKSIMEACGGTWIAHGSGNADKLVVDKENKIDVPLDDPKYTLKRVWLSEEEQKGFYYGVSNEALYPLTHMAHIRPTFRKEDWLQYEEVNKKFAQAVLREIKQTKKPVILIQDFHFALLPKMIKTVRPDAVIQFFWHEPWINSEAFSICPWKKDILEGMLGADLLGFHTQQHCNNFIETVSKELESLIDLEQFTITKNKHTSFIRPFPVSIAFSGTTNNQETEKEQQEKIQAIKKDLNIKSKYVGIGIDRLDYIKGVLERIKGIEILFTKYPEYRKNVTFVQISPPSKAGVKKYQEFAESVKEEVDRVNNLFKSNGWKPIIFLNKLHSHEELKYFYKLADFCLITSLHDGMNLVAKEFIAERDDEKGVLILSQFAGASKELKDALIINPYTGDQTADAIDKALRMSDEEKTTRMKKLRNAVKNYNIYRWGAEQIKMMMELA